MTPPFWSPIMFENQRQLIGFVCQADHPALKHFPTDPHNNWQWYDLTRGGAAINLSGLGSGFRPIVQGIDRPDRCLRLGIIYEGKVGKGRLLICTLDLNRELDKRPVARQLRYSLLSYAASSAFNPAFELTNLQTMIPKGGVSSQLIVWDKLKSISADSENENQWVNFAVDGNSNTFWNTPGAGTQGWEGIQTKHPHHLIVELKRSTKIKGIECIARQNSSEGRIARYNVYVSQDGKSWTKVAEGVMDDTRKPQKILFNKVRASFIKLEALSEVNGGARTSLAEFDIILY